MQAIYARQSIDKKDSISIETQIELCRLKGGADKQYRIYADKGYSGKNMQRPAFQQLLKDVKRQQISKIIIYRLDRLSRSLLDFARMVEFFAEHQVAFISTQEHFDTSTPMGNAMLNIAMVFAQLERETITSRITDNYYSRAKKGLFLGGPPPFGFINTRIQVKGQCIKVLEADAQSSCLLQQLFSLYGEKRLSLSAIAKELNSRQIKSPQGCLWDSSKISRILRNPVYVRADAEVYQYYQARGCLITSPVSDFVEDRGCLLYGKRAGNQRKFSDVSGQYLSLSMHQGLIEARLFLACQQLLDKNIRFGGNSAVKNTWLFSLIRCGFCGATLKVNSSNQGRYLYYACQNRGKDSCCGKFYTTAVKSIEAAVEKQLLASLSALSALPLPQIKTQTRTQKELHAHIVAIAAQREKVIALALDAGEISGKYLEQKLAELESQEQTYRQQLAAQQKGEVMTANPLLNIHNIWPALSPQQKQAIAALLISGIRLDDGGITIIWKQRIRIIGNAI